MFMQTRIQRSRCCEMRNKSYSFLLICVLGPHIKWSFERGQGMLTNSTFIVHCLKYVSIIFIFYISDNGGIKT
jgi:hypothetical protein